ncbi:O-methyltransferase 3 [Vigna angularis]|uniref:O-methyltransferase 3 n=1 Tax=Phaseolus angularis TaxID=3914 RepID=A0A8T0K2W8_PHAAN|nr:O-methyltransferase 3 [Vigna angularis]
MSLKCVVELGIADIIHNHGQPISLSNLIASLPIHSSKTHFIPRLMRILVHSGFFSQLNHTDNELEVKYALTDASLLLLKSHEMSVAPFLLAMLDPVLTNPWNHFSNWFKTGQTTPFELAHGKLKVSHSDLSIVSQQDEAVFEISRNKFVRIVAAVAPWEILCLTIQLTGKETKFEEVSSEQLRATEKCVCVLEFCVRKQPEWTGYRDPTPPSPPPSVDEYSPGQTQSVPSIPSGGTSSSRGSKRKTPMVDVIDSQFDKLTTSLDGFANVLSSSNGHFGVISDAVVRQVSVMEDINQILCSQTEIFRRTPNYTYTEAEIYEMLSAMNIADENLLE